MCRAPSEGRVCCRSCVQCVRKTEDRLPLTSEALKTTITLGGKTELKILTLTLGGEQFDAFRLHNFPLHEDLLQCFLIQSWRSVEEVQNLETKRTMGLNIMTVSRNTELTNPICQEHLMPNKFNVSTVHNFHITLARSDRLHTLEGGCILFLEAISGLMKRLFLFPM